MTTPMTAEQLAVIADDIVDMAQCYIDANDARSLRNSARNLAGMIRIHVNARDATLAAIRAWTESETPYVEGHDTVETRASNHAYARSRVHVHALLDAAQKETP